MRLYDHNAFEQAFPLRSDQIQNISDVNHGLHTSSRNKVKLLVEKLKAPTKHNINYKTFNKVFNKLKRQLNINYYKSIFK